MNNFDIELGKLMAGLAANFSAKMPEGMFEIWSDGFKQKHISIEIIKKAIHQIIETKIDGYGRMPTFAEVFQIIRQNNRYNAELATREVIYYLRKGAEEEPIFSVTTANVINLEFGGWKNLCKSIEERKDLSWFVDKFIISYTGVFEREIPRITHEQAKQIVNRIGGAV